MDVFVEFPRCWWRTRAINVPRWVDSDPDRGHGQLGPVDPREYRWFDRDEQRWCLIAAAVSAVSDELALSRWTPDLDDMDPPRRAIVSITPEEPLTETEKHIVRAWFYSETVRSSPWDTDVSNGRHRLWATREHFGPTGFVPMLCTTLRYATPYETFADLSAEYRQHLAWLDTREAEWFEIEDSLNRRYTAALAEAAAGGHPDGYEIPA